MFLSLNLAQLLEIDTTKIRFPFLTVPEEEYLIQGPVRKVAWADVTTYFVV